MDTNHPSCECCSKLMILGQQGRHYTCQEAGVCTCRDDFNQYRDWVIANVVPVLGSSVTPKPCELHGAPT